MIWEELYLEISYKDILDNNYSSKIFKAVVSVNSNYVSIQFQKSKEIILKKESTMTSRVLAG
jgi:hypothetical protein